MEDMNCINLCGRATADPECKETTNGKSMAKFSVANNRRSGDGVNFFNILCFGKLADIVYQYVRKGMLLAITGRLEANPYVGQDGIKKVNYTIIGEFVRILDKVERGNEAV